MNAMKTILLEWTLVSNTFVNLLSWRKDDKVINFYFLFFKPLIAGEIDGKGIICEIYGNTIGFEDNRAYEHKPKGGKEKLEIYKKEIGKYYTDENFIYFDDIKINRKTLSFKNIHRFVGNAKLIKIWRISKKTLIYNLLQKKTKYKFLKMFIIYS